MGDAIPAGLATTSDGRIHYIIGDKEEGLQQLDTPAQYTSFEVFVIGKLTAFRVVPGIGFLKY